MTNDERAAYRKCLDRSQSSPDIQEFVAIIRGQARVNRERRADLSRKRALLALEIIAGAGIAAFALWCAWKLTEISAR